MNQIVSVDDLILISSLGLSLSPGLGLIKPWLVQLDQEVDLDKPWPRPKLNPGLGLNGSTGCQCGFVTRYGRIRMKSGGETY